MKTPTDSAPEAYELAWRMGAAKAFRTRLFEDYADGVTEEAQAWLLPDDELRDLRDRVRKKVEGPGYADSGWLVTELADVVTFKDFLDALDFGPLEDNHEGFADLMAEMEPDRMVEGDLGGVAYLFDEIERALYISPKGVIHPDFDYEKLSKAAEAEESKGRAHFDTWYLRRI